MSTRMIGRRLDRIEQSLDVQFVFSTDCVCFPENEEPFFCFPIEEEIAAKVKCPIHGRRFKPQPYYIYVSEWYRQDGAKILRERLSRQHKKAWLASFPPDLWPATEDTAAEDGSIYLILKDGTRLLAFEPSWKARST